MLHRQKFQLKVDRQGSDAHRFHGILPAELDQKLCHLLIQQQENQIMELESDLHSAQSKLNVKEAKLQALKDCVKRLTEFSLSAVSGKIILTSFMKSSTSSPYCFFHFHLVF